ncbi:hypothetical protein [Bacillus testis]|nr:hypothetical protein [Bacillus testis]
MNIEEIFLFTVELSRLIDDLNKCTDLMIKIEINKDIALLSQALEELS